MTETPAYDTLRDNLDTQSMSMADALGGTDDPNHDPDPDPDSQVLEAIRDGRTVGSQSLQKQVGTLAGLNYSVETTADALGLNVEDVEIFAQLECERLAELLRPHAEGGE